MNEMFDPEAESHNRTLQKHCLGIYSLLSQKGRAIYFPRKGILQQGKDADHKKINATIGMAIEDNGSPVRLPSMNQHVNVPPEEAFPYAPSFGLPGLRKVWQDQIREKNPSISSPISLPVVTSGLTHGLNMAAYLFVDPGDEIVAPDIMWENYHLIFRLGYGARFRTFPLFDKGGFNLKGFRESISNSSGHPIVLLNFPNNPTGYTCTDAEADAITDILHRRAESGASIAVILDDAYFGLVYEQGVFRESLMSKLAACHENVLAIKIDGATKEDYAWGFRIGFMTYAWRGMTEEASGALVDKTGGAVRGAISSASRLSQSLLLKAMSSKQYHEEKEDKLALLRSRYEKVKEVLALHGERYARHFTPLPFNSGYFMCIRLHAVDAESVRQLLLKEFNSGIIAMNPLIRIAFSSVAHHNIPDLFENIYESCERLSMG